MALQSVCQNKLEKMPSGVGIMIGLEDEQGEIKPVEIDEAEDEQDQDQDTKEPEEPPMHMLGKRKVSITERVLKSRNSEQQLASLQEEAENRKKELHELLTEHAQLVHTVERMQGDSAENSTVASPSSDKENQNFNEITNHAEGKENQQFSVDVLNNVELLQGDQRLDEVKLEQDNIEQ